MSSLGCPSGQPNHLPFLTLLLEKGFLSPQNVGRTTFSCASSRLGGPHGQHPIRWEEPGTSQARLGGERRLLSFPSFPRPCPLTGSGAWSPAAQPLLPRARHSEVAARPARRTWARKGEWPVGVPQVWRPQSLSATPSTIRFPPVGVRAEGPRRTTAPLWSWKPLTGPALLLPHPLGQVGPLPAGTKEADGSEGEGGP